MSSEYSCLSSSGRTSRLFLGVIPKGAAFLFALALCVLFLTPPTAEATWQSQYAETQGKSLESVHFIDSSTGWVVGAGGIILKTVNGGATWTAQVSGTTSTLRSVDFVDGNYGCAVGDNATVLKTVNGGATWTAQDVAATSRLVKVRIFNANDCLIYGVGANNQVEYARTTNGGSNWLVFVHPVNSASTCAYFADINTGWAGGLDSYWRTTDGGSSISFATNVQQLGSTPAAVHFVDSNNGWSVGSGGVIVRTTDGGATWSGRTFGTTANLRALDFADASHGWAVGDGGAILFTGDSGTTWIAEDAATTANLRSVDFSDVKNGWAVGEGGVILKWSPGTPQTQLSFMPVDGAGGWWRTPPSINAPTSEPAMTFYSWESSSGPWTIWNAPLIAAEGTSTVYYRSIGGAGDAEPVRSQSFAVDTTVSAPSSITATGVTTDGVTIGWTPVTDLVSGLDHYVIQLLRASGVVAESTVPNGTRTTLSGLLSGTMYFARVNAVDGAGNSQASDLILFRTAAEVTPPPPPPTDPGASSAPAAPVFIDPVVPIGWSNHDALLNLATTPDSGKTTITYAVNGGPTQAYNGSIHITAEGTTTITYQATNEAGISSEVKTVRILIDRTPPSAIQAPTVATRTADAVTLSWTAAADAQSGTVRYDVYDNGVLIGSTYSTSISLTGLAPGVHAFTIQAVDAAGGRSPAGSATVVEVAFTPTPLASVLTPVPNAEVPTMPTDARLIYGFDTRGQAGAAGSVNLEMPYDRNLPDERAANLAVMAWIDGHWVRIPCIVDTEHHTVRFTLPRATHVALVEPSSVDATSRLLAAVKYNQTAYRRGNQIRVKCVNAYGAPLLERVIKLYMNSGSSSKVLTMTANPLSPGTYQAFATPLRASGPTHLSFIFTGDAITTASSATSVLMPRARLSLGRIVSSIHVGKSVRVMGILAPAHSGHAKVVIIAERVSRGRVVARVTNTIYTRARKNAFSSGITLKTRGSWRIRLVHSDSTHCASHSGYRYLRVK